MKEKEVILLEKQVNSSTIAYLLIYSASNITYLSGQGQKLFVVSNNFTFHFHDIIEMYEICLQSQSNM